MSSVWGGNTVGVPIVQSQPAVVDTDSVILQADTGRSVFGIQNNSATKNIRLNFGAAATVSTFKIIPGQTYFFPVVPTNEIHAMGELAGVGSALGAGEAVIITNA